MSSETPDALLKRAILELRDLRQKLAAVEQAKTEPIAVVGMGCRFPAGADDPDAYWRLLRDGTDAIREFPAERLPSGVDLSAHRGARWGGFLDGVDGFDPQFFGISPREAIAMDPQQRLVLEVAWEAIEDAGQVKERLSGSRTGVYIGVCNTDYAWLQVEHDVPADVHSVTGSSSSVVAGRLSFLLDLQGPSLVVDTACSSALVALHLACQSLRGRECDMALAGGVNLILSPRSSLMISKLDALSPDGRCKTFDAAANGFVRGEGCGVVVLKRLSDALADRDRVLCLIRGSAVNQDGGSVGLTAPNVLAQEKLLREALSAARVSPLSVSYIEAHGTGTPLGDPMEIEALCEAYGGAGGGACAIGSVKTNIGHLEAAAGISGLIKVVLALRHEAIPPHLHLKALNPRISFEGTRFFVPTALRPWPAADEPRRAALSSFGISGTNAHMILEEPPRVAEETHAASAALLVLSARAPAALRALAQRYAEHLSALDEAAVALRDLCYTAAFRRDHHEHRLAIAGCSRGEIAQKLRSLLDGDEPPALSIGQSAFAGERPVFIFCGQGAQWQGMGLALLEEDEAFRGALLECDAVFREQSSFSLLDALKADAATTRLDQTVIAQPAIFAIQVALAAMWRSLGVEPAAVVGHSVGEIAAAHVAGALSLAEAARIVVHRGRVMQRATGAGRMAVVELPFDEASREIALHAGRLCVAAINTEGSVVLSGDTEALNEVLGRLRDRGIFTRDLGVSYAFHSHHMDPLQAELEAALGRITAGPTSTPMISTVTGALLDGRDLDAAYWVANMRRPVHFAAASGRLIDEGHHLFLEVGPQPALSRGLSQALARRGEGGAVLPSMRKEGGRVVALGAAGALYAHGHPLDWKRLYPAGGRVVSLPAYPWQRSRYWVELGEPRATPPAVAGGGSDDLRYDLAWVPQASPASPPGATGGTWLVLGPDEGVASALASRLVVAGQTCVLALSGPDYAMRADGVRVLDPNDAGHWDRLLGELGACHGIVLLFDPDPGAVEDRTPAAVCAAEEAGCLGVVRLTQALARLEAKEKPRVWLVTRGCQAVDGGACRAPVHAAVWGLGRIIALEHPEIWGGLVDLDPAPGAEEIALLASVVSGGSEEDQLALRCGVRYVARLVRSGAPAAQAPIALRADATYLITGGLGGLGLHVARWMVERGARHLVLVGRRGLPERSTWSEVQRDSRVGLQIAAIEAMEALEAHVDVVSADVGDWDRMRAVMEPIATGPFPLRGVIHAAGVSAPLPLKEIDESALRSSLWPKAAGAWALHLLTRGMELDFTVYFSSGASLWGSAQMASYAAANHVLDALAHYRRAIGQRTISVNWGPWASEGMATSEAQAWFAKRGVGAISDEEGLRALGELLGLEVAQRAVARVDWRVLKALYEARSRRPLLDVLVPPCAAPRATVKENGAGEKSAFLAELHRAPAERRQALMIAWVRDEVAKVLGFATSASVSLDQGFFDAGMDSLTAVELRGRLSARLGLLLPTTIAFDHATVRALAAHLLREVAAEPPAPAPTLARPASTEPIAVIGLGCRFPKAAEPEAFWELLTDGVDALREVPAERWDVDAYYDPEPGVSGKTYTRRGGFLDHVDRFDAQFFGIVPAEATSMDPQHRLLLEVAWEALEHAALVPERLATTRTGVFVGIGSNEYAHLDGDRVEASSDVYAVTGNDASFAAGRLSYVLRLQGPAMSVNTACSSSLVAVHLACQSLRAGESDLALAAGVSLMLSPQTTVYLSQLRALAPDGRCKTFDATADGYARGEGCGVVVLKRLSDAQRDGDRILALIRGSAVNHDGPSGGLTVPNGSAQQRVLEAALASAGVAPADVDYVEAHGTGTSLGDPLEVQALARVFCKDRPADRRMAIGSVKTNLGHLEAAAGIAGLIKVVLSLQNGVVPRHLHLQTPSPHLRLDEVPLYIPTRQTPWLAGERPRLAGVSAFGLSGTNAHVVLEEAPRSSVAEGTPPASVAPARVRLLTLAAKTSEGLREMAARLAEHIATHPDDRIADIGRSTGTERSHFAHRLALAVESPAGARDGLEAFARGEEARLVAGYAAGDAPPAVAFLFTGQGAQYAGMGRQLYEAEPIFRAAFDRCAAVLDGELDAPLRSLLHGESSARIDETGAAQPALFALEYALSELWCSWGITPSAVLGHSVGEVVAACVAGVLDLDDALRLIAARGRLMQALPRDGEMVALAADEARVAAAIAPHAAEVSIAAINGPNDVVISGARARVDAIVLALQAEGVKSRRLAVSHAFHSPQMDPMLDAFERVLATIPFHAPRIPLISNVTGRLLDVSEAMNAAYFLRQVREPVRFESGVRALAELGVHVFVELGPHPTLSGLGMKVLGEGEDAAWLPSLRKGHSELRQMLSSLGALYVRGLPVNFSALSAGEAGRRVDLPTYPWQRQRFWMDAPRGSRRADARSAAHPLVGRRVFSPLNDALTFEARYSVEALPFLGDHRLYETVVVPGSSHVARLLSTAAGELGAGACTLTDCLFPQPIVLVEGEERTVQLVLSPAQVGDRYTFQVFSLDPATVDEGRPSWTLHAAGDLAVGGQAGPAERPAPPRISRQEIEARCLRRESGQAVYAASWQLGFHLGEAFQWIEELCSRPGEALCRMRLPTDRDDATHVVHPGLIDSCFQLLAAALSEGASLSTVYVPISVERFTLHHRPEGIVWAHASLREQEHADEELVTGEVRLIDGEGRVLIEVGGLKLKRAQRHALLGALRRKRRDALYEIVWKPRPLAAVTPPAPGRWLVFADEGGLAEALAAELAQRGCCATLVEAGDAYARRSDDHFTLAATRAEDYGRLLDDVASANGLPLAGIVHLWSLSAPFGARRSLHASRELVLGGVMHLVQALGRRAIAPPPRLRLVTRGARAVNGSHVSSTPIAVEQAPLWGLGAVLATEHPEMWGGLIDLAPTASGDDARVLSEELCAPDGEDQIAWREGRRYAARLSALGDGPTASAPLALRADASYLVTGGLGGLGLATAQWMVDRGARHLVLVGRSDPGPAALRAIEAMERADARILAYRADISKRDEVERLLALAAREFPVLRGLVHAAGVLADGSLMQQDWGRFAKVLAPKVDGASHLHDLTRALELDFFVLFSSAAALLGAPGQANYAAANAYLDALAYHRRSQGLPALSVAWGPWAEVGMAAPQAHRFEAQGIETLSPAEGTALLERLLRGAPAQAVALRVDWPRYLRQLSVGAPPLLSAWAAPVEKAAPASSAQAAQLRSRLEAVGAAQRLPIALEHVRAAVLKVLGLDPSHPLEPRQRLFDAGFDSLMALELRNQLQRSAGVVLPSTLVFDHPTVESMARYLLVDVLSLGEPESAGPEPGDAAEAQDTALVDRIKSLSDDEIDASIAAKLAALLD